MSKGISQSKHAMELAISSMNESLTKLYEKVASIDASLNQNDLICHHKLGTEINKLFSETAANTYGSGAVDKLAAAMQRSRAYIDQARRFATSWTLDELKAMIETYKQGGTSLTYTHVRMLMYINDPTARAKLTERCVVEYMSSSDLEAAIGKLLDREKAGKVLAPRTPAAGLTQLKLLSTKLLERRDVFESKVFAALDRLQPKDANDALLDGIDQTETSLSDLEDFIVSARKRLRSVRSTVLGITAKKESLRPKTVVVERIEPEDDFEEDDEDEELPIDDLEDEYEEPAPRAVPTSKLVRHG